MSKTPSLYLIIFLLTLVAPSSFLLAQVPQPIAYQSYLTESQGNL